MCSDSCGGYLHCLSCCPSSSTTRSEGYICAETQAAGSNKRPIIKEWGCSHRPDAKLPVRCCAFGVTVVVLRAPPNSIKLLPQNHPPLPPPPHDYSSDHAYLSTTIFPHPILRSFPVQYYTTVFIRLSDNITCCSD